LEQIKKSSTNMEKEKSVRPSFLTALCILSFIGSGLGFVGYFLASVFFAKTSELIIEYSNWHSVEAISPMYFTLFMALSAGSLIGAIRIWKLHRDGFYIYTAAQIIMLFLPVFWIGQNSLSATGAIFTAIFIGGYALNFKWLKN
jgi:hypothetical protein